MFLAADVSGGQLDRSKEFMLFYVFHNNYAN